MPFGLLQVFHIDQNVNITINMGPIVQIFEVIAIIKLYHRNLDKETLDFKKYRGIGVDNATRMAGVQGSVQRLRNINGKAKFVPCSNHRL